MLYSDTLRDENNAPIAGMQVYVYSASGQLAAGLEDELGDPLSNPLTTDTFGNFAFVADDGFYTLDLFLGGRRAWKQNIILGVIPLDGAKGLLASNRGALAAISGQSAGQSALLGEAGREGTFVFSAANISAFVTADPQQGVYIAPASAPTGASGAWVRKFSGAHSVKWFGAVADNATDDSAAFLAAIAYLKVLATYNTGYGIGSPKLYVPAGNYYLSAAISLTHTLVIEGEGVGSFGGAPTRLRWPAGTDGFQLQRFNTSGTVTVDGVTHQGADGSILRGLLLEGGLVAGTTAEGEFHAIRAKCRFTAEDVLVRKWQGDGFYIRASGGAGTPTEGNANCFALMRCTATECRNGLFTLGADANAGTIIGGSFIYNRAWGVSEGSFLGNYYFGPHLEANGFAPHASLPTSMVSYSGNRFAPKVGRAVQCSTNAPPVTAVDDVNWYYLSAGGVTVPQVPLWVNGISVREGGAIYGAGGTNASQFKALYTEGSQSPTQVDTPGQIDGGFHGAAVKGTGIYTYGYLGQFRMVQALVDQILTTGNIVTSGFSLVPDVQGILNVGRYSAAFGKSAINFNGGSTGGQFQVGGANAALLSLTAFDLSAGSVFKVNGTQVVGTQGAAVADAAALTSANGTNAAGVPTQAEFNALVAEFNKLRTDLGATRTQLNLALARLRAATGHGLIA